MRYQTAGRRHERRGVILILVLGMLGLLALIGVTFATFTGQARIGSRNYAQALLRPDASDLMDYALSQLIGDTNDIRSAIRGHSMARDMYGNDGVFNGLLAYNPALSPPSNYLQFTAATVLTPANVGTDTHRVGLIRCVTNIPLNSAALYGFDFTRWVVKFPHPDLNPYYTVSSTTAGLSVGQTFEVILDDYTTGSGGMRTLYLAPPAYQKDAKNLVTGYVGQRAGYTSPEVPKSTGVTVTATVQSELVGESLYQPPASGNVDIQGNNPPANPGIPLNTAFVLDGRFLHAFNGPGLGTVLVPKATAGETIDEPASKFANFRYNGNLLANNGSTASLGDPNIVGMDEDYDACDLENWFLAIQSADGRVVIPSFHRPGILRHETSGSNPHNDWADFGASARSRILRPRSADGHDAGAFPDLIPGGSGQINYDVDNDGDGASDSVWVDLGYPPTRDSRNQLFKPMFAFLVVGLNGRIPLNTAGNLQLRDNNGIPVYMNASHLGYSPSEIDPTYALQGFFDILSGGPSPQVDNAYVTTASPPDNPISLNVTQLRNLLAGTRPSGYDDNNFFTYNNSNYFLPNNVPDSADTNVGKVMKLNPQSVPGRWGEGTAIPSTFKATLPLMSFPNLVRAGVSLPFKAIDPQDDNANTYDPWPSTTRPEFSGNSNLAPNVSGGWPADYYDAAGDLGLPVERMRRFVTPVDVAGDGSLLGYLSQQDLGADTWGRVAFKKYFRPPGVPVATETYKSATQGVPSVPDITNNPLHGYEAQRNPAMTITNPAPNLSLSTLQPLLLYGAAPIDVDSSGAQVKNNGINTVTTGFSATPAWIPTFNGLVNSVSISPDANFLPAWSPNLDEANELNPYQPSANDQPFGHGDLEWLYRAHDKDGASLNSRLASLAPISFTNTYDGIRHRRMFSVDTWESNAMVLANDNYGNNYSDNSRAAFPDQTFVKKAIANGRPLLTPNSGLNSAYLQDLAIINGQTANIPVSQFSQNQGAINYVNTAGRSLGHRERKINLNYPLPVSNNPDEPTRQKWIMESYQVLKQILPPLSLDTPEELAKLSQFLVNVIDFRDPDSTMTHFVNPDLFIRVGTAQKSPGLVPAGSQTTTDIPLNQYGMEYNPVAISEVLAYQFITAIGQTGTNTVGISRLFIEMVNTLTADNYGTSATLDLGGFSSSPTDPYSGACWDLIFTDDTPFARPDPFNGQLLPLPAAPPTPGYYGLIPLYSGSFTSGTTLQLPPLAAAGYPASTPPANYFNVIANQLPTGYSTAEQNPLNTNTSIVAQSLQSQLDPMNQAVTPTGTPPFTTIPDGVLPHDLQGQPVLAVPGRIQQLPFTPTSATKNSKYYWVCLRRPANLFAPVSATNPMVVVDSFRFPYLEGTGLMDGSTKDKDGNTVPNVTKANQLYSMQRFQPYRGGHKLPLTYDDTAGNNIFDSYLGLPFDPTCYGYTEELGIMAGQAATQKTFGVFSYDTSKTPPVPYPSTSNSTYIFNSLGARVDSPDQWEYFPFHDRDFTSAGELLLVPGCPPGLFTKQFVENSPTSATAAYFNGASYINIPSQDLLPSSGRYLTIPNFPNLRGQVLVSNIRPTFPHLVDRFFYSSASPVKNGSPTNWNQADGPSSGGWSRMFDIFEVPSTVMGATGQVSQGVNYDWFRQDQRPGMLNLNLIIDEEVFLGLMGNAGAPMPPPATVTIGGNAYAVQQVLHTPTNLNADVTTDAARAGNVVTQSNSDGTVNKSYPMVDPPNFQGFIEGAGTHHFKWAFLDFLNNRHDGSGHMFGALTEAPFRSFSFPDVNYTPMRPAFKFAVGKNGITGGDSGVKNNAILKSRAVAGTPLTRPMFPPATPPRRVFQIPDDKSGSATSASYNGDSYEMGYSPSAAQIFSLISGSTHSTPDRTLGSTSIYKQHPYYRSEWMQKIVNLSTVRTHQYAVWVTVGFFEVKKPGDTAEALATGNVAGAYDILGREIGSINGKNVRYRGFFIVDRLKLQGFDPTAAGKFRDAVLYRRIIQ